jgi:hypothetical protein
MVATMVARNENEAVVSPSERLLESGVLNQSVGSVSVRLAGIWF